MNAAVRSIKRHQPAELVTAVLVRRSGFEPDYAASYFAGKVVFPWQMSDEDSQGPLERVINKERNP